MFEGRPRPPSPGRVVQSSPKRGRAAQDKIEALQAQLAAEQSGNMEVAQHAYQLEQIVLVRPEAALRRLWGLVQAILCLTWYLRGAADAQGGAATAALAAGRAR